MADRVDSRRNDAEQEGAAGSDTAVDLELLKMASEHFRQDIASHWAQASFFAVIQAAFISVFTTSIGPHDVGGSGLLSVRATATMIASAGFVFALLWFAMAAGREKYIRLWRRQVVLLDRTVDRHQVYVNVERTAAEDRLNPTILVSAVPLIIGLGWLVAVVWLQAVLR
jgi:hypothetical protein